MLFSSNALDFLTMSLSYFCTFPSSLVERGNNMCLCGMYEYVASIINILQCICAER